MIVTEEQLADYIESGKGYPITDDRYCLIVRTSKDWNEYVASCALGLGYNQIDIQYNNLLFGGAANMLSKATLLLNPWLKVPSFQFIPPNYRKSAYDVLAPMTENVDVSGYSIADIKTFNRLANGWDSESAYEYYKQELPSIPMKRISCGLAINSGDLESGHLLLHPWLPRPLSDNEITALMACSFFDTMKIAIANTETLSEAVLIEPMFVDISQTIPHGYDGIVPNPYKWQRMTAK